MKYDYLGKVERMIEELRSHQLISLVKCDLYEPLSHEEVANIEEDFKLNLPTEVSEFYKQVGGLNLEWIATIPQNDVQKYQNRNISGHIHLLPLENVFAGWEDDEWLGNLWFNWMTKEQQISFRKLKPLDYFDDQDSGCICFMLEDNLISEALYYHSVDYGINQIVPKFQEYIEMLFETRGFFRWQLFVLSENENAKSDINYSDFLSHMNRLFPDSDFSHFRER